MLAAVNFHYIRDDFSSKYPGIYGQTPLEFENQLKVLSSIGTFVSAAQIISHLKEGIALPEKSILITFDDGLKEQFTKALPILDRLKIPALFFANTKPITEKKILTVHKIHILRSQIAPDEFKASIEKKLAQHDLVFDKEKIAHKARQTYRYDTQAQKELKYLLNFELNFELKESIIDAVFFETFGDQESEICDDLYFSTEQMKSLANRGYLGNHSHSHYPIGLLNDLEKDYEIRHSKKILEEITNRSISTFSFPYGSVEACNQGAEVLQKNDFIFSFTMERAINTDFKNSFYLSRFDTNDVPGGKYYKYDKEEFFERFSVKEPF